MRLIESTVRTTLLSNLLRNSNPKIDLVLSKDWLKIGKSINIGHMK